MTFLFYLIVVLHVIACLFLIAVVLLQQGKGQDLASAFGGGAGTQAAFGPRGSANVLSRATAILAGVFMVTSLGLPLVKPRQASVLDRLPAAAATPTPAPAAPATTTAPAPAAPAACQPPTK
jgi:preprotein translocase subunit SecG